MRSTTRWWMGGLAFVLPLLLGILTDLVASAKAFSDLSIDVVFELFVASVFVAAGVTGYVSLTAPVALGKRLGLVALIWLMLLLEAYCTMLWILRGAG